MINRRGFLKGLLAAPAIVAASNIMPVKLWLPEVWGDGIHDDAEGLQAWLNGERVADYTKALTKIIGDPQIDETSTLYYISSGTFRLGKGLDLPKHTTLRGCKFIADEGFGHADALLKCPSHTTILSDVHAENLSKNPVMLYPPRASRRFSTAR